MGKMCVCHYEPESKRQTIEWKDTDSGKEIVLGTAVSKGDADNLQGHERTHHILEKAATVNCFLLPTPWAKLM